MKVARSLWIGLMSGTSADGVDAALVRIGATPSEIELVASLERPISEECRSRIHEIGRGSASLRDVAALDGELGALFADAAHAVMEQAGVRPVEVEGIGSHGQTVGHFPEPDVRGSVQIGSPSVIHQRTGIPVVADFRAADLAAGGQGAPLTPYLHHAVLSRRGESRAVLNIGGFTNVTFLPASGRAEAVVAFDPGPGNALLDRVARLESGGERRFDRDGELAQAGTLCRPVLDALLADPYFAETPPKSTGHEQFGAAFFERARSAIDARGGTVADLAATLAALTVESVVRASRFAPEPPARWILYGGGVHNPVLMRGLRQGLAPAAIETTDEYGLPADAVEAISFALLGYCASRGMPSNLPAATGAEGGVSLGSLVPPGAFRSRA